MIAGRALATLKKLRWIDFAVCLPLLLLVLVVAAIIY